MADPVKEYLDALHDLYDVMGDTYAVSRKLEEGHESLIKVMLKEKKELGLTRDKQKDYNAQIDKLIKTMIMEKKELIAIQKEQEKMRKAVEIG